MLTIMILILFQIPPYYPFRTKVESHNSSLESTTSTMESPEIKTKARENDNHKCTNCNKEYDSSSDLQAHMQNHHIGEANKPLESEVKQEIKQETVEEEDDEQIDVGDHHSEEPVRSSEEPSPCPVLDQTNTPESPKNL